MSNIKTNNDFNNLIAKYYQILKEGYLLEIDKASDKKYAEQHFQEVLFLENSLTPYNTILLKELHYVYHHYSCLISSTAYEETAKLLNKVYLIARNQLDKAILYKNGNTSIDFPEHYSQLILEKNLNLTDLIAQEKQALQLTHESLIGSLALSLAGKQLHKEFNEIQPVQKETNHRHKFTQKQQVLALFFLMEAFGIKSHSGTDMTKLSALYHLILGVPFHDFDRLKNTNIYKSIRVAPQVVNSDKHLLKNLQVIKPYFENVNLLNVVELINQQINVCKQNISE